MIIGVPKESVVGENRISLVPRHVPLLQKEGFIVHLESGAGIGARFTDARYEEEGVKIIPNRENLFNESKIILTVRGLRTNDKTGSEDLNLLKENQILIGLMDPFNNLEVIKELAKRKIQSFALELIPRISRAQSMDVLSSQANIAGYKAALIAANLLPKMFPMMMTSAGTLTPARVFVIGAGVAGLQAIATCHRLGAVVNAYDIRPVVKDLVQSLGAKFVELELETESAEGEGGYAKEMDENFYREQRKMMNRVISESDVVIATAAVPGKKAPVLISGEMIQGMKEGSVIVDLAAEQGGNCEVTEPGKTVEIGGVVVSGPLNVPSSIPHHSSQMFSKNITNFFQLMVKDGKLITDVEDEIVQESMVTNNGEIVNSQIKETLGL